MIFHKKLHRFISCLLSFSLFFQSLAPTLIYAQEATQSAEVTITPTESIAPTPEVTLTPSPTPEPIWQQIDEKTITTSKNIAEGVDYRFQDSKVSVRFTKIQAAGKLTIREVKLTLEQIAQTGALSDVAYDITSDMENGTFSYDLTLPLPKDEPEVKVEFAANQDSLAQSQTIDTNVTHNSEVIEIKGLSHFTLFFVTSGADQATNGDFCTSLSLPCTFNTPTLTSLQIDDGFYLDIADYTASGSIGWPNLSFSSDRYVQFDFSPAFDLGATISNAKLKFVYETSAIDPSLPYGAKVEITDDNSTWTEIASTTTQIGPNLSTSDQTYQLTLPAFFQNPTSLNNLKVRFFLYGDDQTLPSVLTSFDQVILDTSTTSTFIYTSTYIRANSTSDIGGQVRVPDYATEVNYLFSSPNYTVTVPGYKHIQAGFSPWAGYAHWRVKPSLPNDEYQVTASYLVGTTTGVIPDSAVLYSLDKPWAKWVYPNNDYRYFRPSDNPLRVQVDDEFNQFSHIIFNLDGQNFRVDRDQCDLREAGNRLICDVNDSSTWNSMADGTYDTYSTGNTTAKVKATIYTKANNRFDPADFIESDPDLSTRTFYIDSTPPVLSDLTVDNTSLFYTNLAITSANATDNLGVKNISFYMTLPRTSDGICDGNGAKIFQQTSATPDIDGRYRTSIDTSTLNGEYCLNAVAEDNAVAHSNIEKIKMVFDNTPPNVPGIPTTSTPTNSLIQVWNWTAATDSGGSDASGIKGYWFNTSVTPAWISLGNFLFTSTNFLSEGVSQFSVKAEDNAGNLGDASTGEVTLDLSSPEQTDKSTFTGWYNSDKVSTFAYTDNVGVVSGVPVTCTISTEGENQTCSVTPNVCDAAGNCNTTSMISNGANIDKTFSVLTFSDDVSSGPVMSEDVILAASDTNLDPSTTQYGFSDDAVCDSTDTFGNTFVSGESFSFSDQSSNGKYLCAIVADLAGNITYQISSNPLNVDITNPVGNITNPANSSYQRTRPTYRVTASDSNGIYSVKFQYRLFGNPDFIDLNTDLTSTYQANWGSVILTTNSVYELRAIVTDNPGNFDFTPIISFTFDNRLPDILYNNPLGGQTVWYNYSPSFDVDFLYDASSAPLDYAQYRVDLGTYKNIFTTDRTADYTTNWSIASWSTLTEGSHQLDIRLRDKASNINTDNYLVDISGLMVGKDLTDPIVTVPDDQTLEATGPDGATYEFSPIPNASDANSSPATTCDHFSGETFPLGITTITCSATDTAGNTANEIFKVTVSDTTNPATADDTDSSWHNTNVTVTLSCTDAGSGCANTYYTTNGSTPTTESFSGTSISLTSNGIYTIKYFSGDGSGNIESVKTAENQVRIDKTPPAISFGSPTNSSLLRSTVLLQATGSDEGGSGLNPLMFSYRRSVDEEFTEIGTDSETPYELSWDTTGVTDGDYVLRVAASDGAGNISWSDINVTIDNTNPTKPVATPPAGDYNSDQSVTLSSSDEGSGLASIYYTTDGSIPDITKTLYEGAISVDKDMTIKAVAYDNAGNASDILEAVYGIAPVISAETFSSVTSTTTTITWTTDDLSTSRVIYDTVPRSELGSAPNYGYAFSTTEDPIKVLSHSVSLSGLTAGTTYYYRVISHGSPETVSTEKTFATSSSSDSGGGNGGSGVSDGRSDGLAGQAPVCNNTKPGSAPTLLSALGGINQVTLNWAEAIDPLTYYLITYGTKSGAQTYGNPNVGGKGTTGYTVSGLSGGITYYFQVRAGNGCAPGDFSNEISVTTLGAAIATETPAEGFTPGVKGVSTDLAPTPTPSTTPTSAVLGDTKNNQFSWWLIFLLLATGGFGAWIFFRRK